MNRLIAAILFWATLIAVGLFVFGAADPTVGWRGLLNMIPHCPSLLLRWVGIWQILESNIFTLVDIILRVTRNHLWLDGLSIILLASFPSWIANKKTEAKKFFWPCLLIAYALISAIWSGMFLARGATAFLSDNYSEEQVQTVAADFEVGRFGLDKHVCPSVLDRIGHITRAPLFVQSISDSDLLTQMSKLSSSIEQAWDLVVQKDTSTNKVKMSTVLARFDCSSRLQSRLFAYRASSGIGGDPGQPWRKLSFTGPAQAKIIIHTNFLKPSWQMSPLLPGATTEGKQNVVEGFRAEVLKLRDQKDPIMLDVFSHIHFPEEFATIVKTEHPSDILVYSWYNLFIDFSTVKLLLQDYLSSSAPSFSISPIDRYGDLDIYIHNSQASYNKELGGQMDIAGSGIYLPKSNKIHVWADERDIIQREARTTLEQLEKASHALSQPSANKNEIDLFIATRALTEPLEIGTKVVYPHELTHWVIHVLLADAPWSGTELPPALDEGFALMLDDIHRRQLIIAKKSYGLSTADRKPVMQEWPKTWLDLREHQAQTPAELVTMTPEAFYQSPAINYPDSWALAVLFGSSILNESVARKAHPAEIVRMNASFQVPWSRIQRDIRTDPTIPSNIRKNFEPFLH